MSNKAFPALAVVGSDLWCFYREGAGHLPSDGKGTIKYQTSSDGGATWSAASTLVNDATNDARDPMALRLSDGTVLVSFFYADTTTDGAVGSAVMRTTNDGSSWSEVSYTHTFTDWAALSGRMVELSNGDVLLAAYGEDTGDSYSSVRVSKSTDSGATWTALAEIADGQTASRDYQEPSLCVLGNGDVLCMMRTGISQYYTSTSTDNGATWSAPSTPGFDDSPTGRPDIFRTSDGTIIMAYRQGATSGSGAYRFSLNDGATWSAKLRLYRGGVSSSEAYWTYSQMIEYDGDVVIAYAWQSANTSSSVFVSRFTNTPTAL